MSAQQSATMVSSGAPQLSILTLTTNGARARRRVLQIQVRRSTSQVGTMELTRSSSVLSNQDARAVKLTPAALLHVESALCAHLAVLN